MKRLNRRDFFKMGAGALAGTLLPFPALAAVGKYLNPRRTLAFYNTHTQEQLHICYYEHGAYQPEALAKINYILRDHRTNTIKPIAPRLLDLLFTIKSRIRPGEPFHVISGYRSPTTNEMLRRFTGGVVKGSLHTEGKAIDIRLPGYRTARLRNVCIELKTGGVGYYPQSDFVHLDIGRVRMW